MAELHPDVASLGLLLGTWEGRGTGEYPTIQPFAYVETVTFGHVGKPFLAYTQRTADVADGRPLHSEVGYLRQPSPGRIEWVIVHPSGVVEIEEGTWDGVDLEVATTSVGLTSTAKVVSQLERSLHVVGDTLAYTLRMAAVGQPLVHHLAAELHRTAEPPDR